MTRMITSNRWADDHRRGGGRRNPAGGRHERAAVTVLGVSAGAATAEQLARVAVSAAGDGREIAGIIMADPDPADQTTGRLPQPARPAPRSTPTRLYPNDGDATMKGKNRHAVPSLNGDADLPERFWAYDDFASTRTSPPPIMPRG